MRAWCQKHILCGSSFCALRLLVQLRFESPSYNLLGMVISDVRLWRHNLMIGSAWPQLHKQSALMALTAMFSLRNPLLVSARSLCKFIADYRSWHSFKPLASCCPRRLKAWLHLPTALLFRSGSMLIYGADIRAPTLLPFCYHCRAACQLFDFDCPCDLC